MAVSFHPRDRSAKYGILLSSVEAIEETVQLHAIAGLCIGSAGQSTVPRTLLEYRAMNGCVESQALHLLFVDSGHKLTEIMVDQSTADSLAWSSKRRLTAGLPSPVK